MFTILSELRYSSTYLSKSIFSSHYPHPHLDVLCTIRPQFQILNSREGRTDALRFAADVFSRQEEPRGLDGFASSVRIPVGRPYSTCHRFGFSHSFLKAPHHHHHPPPRHARKKRTQANCQKRHRLQSKHPQQRLRLSHGSADGNAGLKFKCCRRIFLFCATM